MGDQQSREEQQGLVSDENVVHHGGHTNRAPVHNRGTNGRAMPSNSHLFDSSGESDAHSSSSGSERRPRQRTPHSSVNFRGRRYPSNRIASQSTHMSNFSSSVPDIARTNSPVDLSQTGDEKRPEGKMSRSNLSQSVYGGINGNGNDTRSSSSSSGVGEFSQSTHNLISSRPSNHQQKHQMDRKPEASNVGLLASQQVFSSSKSRSGITNNSIRSNQNDPQAHTRQSENLSENVPYQQLSQPRHTGNMSRNFPYDPSSHFNDTENSPRNKTYNRSSQSTHLENLTEGKETPAIGLTNQVNIREAWMQFQQMQQALQQLQTSSNQILQEMDNEQRENDEWVSVIKKKATGIENRLQRMEDKAMEDEQTLTFLEDLVKTLCNKFDDLEIMVKTMSGQEIHDDKTVNKTAKTTNGQGRQTDMSVNKMATTMLEQEKHTDKTTAKPIRGQERHMDETVEAESKSNVRIVSVPSSSEVENNKEQMIDLSTLPEITRDHKGYKDRQTERRQDNRRQIRKERRNGRTVRSGQNEAITSDQSVSNIGKTEHKTPPKKAPSRQASQMNSSSHTTEQRLPRLESVSDAESTDSLLDSRNDYRNLAVLASGKRVLPSIDQETIPDNELYWRSLIEREKQAAKRSTLQKGEGSETFLVLDTSDSMRGQPFTKMIQTAKTFINGVLDQSELTHESICIVEVGQTTHILVHMTNDKDKLLSSLGQLRPGGMSPITGALLLVQELIHRSNSKIVVISDGKMTPIHIKSGQDLPELDNEHQKVQLLLLSENMKNHNAKVFFVPVGPYDSSFMEGIVKATGGDEIEPDQIHRLYNWTRNTLLSLELAKEFKKQYPGEQINDELFMSMAERMVGSSLNTTPEDIVMDASGEGYIVRVGVRTMKNNNSQQELKDMVKLAADSEDTTCGYIECDPNMPPIGTRVRRGPDWRWGNQDIEMAGTIVSHTKIGCIWVEWDYGNIYRYRYGADGCYDVVTTEDPRLLEGDQTIAVGCVVKKGINWESSDNRGPGKIGVVYMVNDDGSVQVRWSNGKMEKHKFGQNGRFEVEICDPLQQRLHLESMGASSGYPLGNKLSSASKDTAKDDEVDPIVAEMNRKNAQRSKQTSHDVQQDRDNIRTGKSTSVKTTKSASHQSTQKSSDGNGSSISGGTDNQKQKPKERVPSSQTTQPKERVLSSQTTQPTEMNIPSNQTQQSTLKLVQKTDDVDKPDATGPNGSANSEVVIAMKGHGIWQYKDGYGGWKSYNTEHNDKLEKGYCHHPVGASLLTIGKSSYRILFSKFKQVNTKTKEMIDIRRLVPQS